MLRQGIVLKDAATGVEYPELRSKKAGVVSILQGAFSRTLIPVPGTLTI